MSYIKIVFSVVVSTLLILAGHSAASAKEIKGSVVDIEGNAIEAVSVGIADQYVTHTDSNGNYTLQLPDDTADDTLITFYHIEYRRAEIPAGRLWEYKYNIVLTHWDVIPDRTIKGHVTDEGKKPVAFASVEIKEINIMTLTDEQGRFTLEVPERVDPGYINMTISFSLLGYYDARCLSPRCGNSEKKR